METIIIDSGVNLLQHLSQFTGTEEYYNHSLSNMKLLLTDGCHFVREQCEAYWLFDLIISHQLSPKVRNEPFQVWTLQHLNNRWFITCHDGNNILLAKQHIEFSDFPLEHFVVWIEDGVALLPSEH